MTEEDNIEKIKNEMRYQGRVRYLADAAKANILRSGIPKRYMQIKPNEFQNMLCSDFHKGNLMSPSELTDFIYKTPLEALKANPIMIIDGGKNVMNRKKAGSAMLFRFMAAQKNGLMKDFGEINEDYKKFIATNTYEAEQELKSKDILFLGEFRQDILQKSPSAALNFWDSILEYRYDNNKTTIFSFTKPLPSNESNMLADQSCGLFMPLLVNHDLEPELDVLRVRIKT